MRVHNWTAAQAPGSPSHLSVASHSYLVRVKMALPAYEVLPLGTSPLSQAGCGCVGEVPTSGLAQCPRLQEELVRSLLQPANGPGLCTDAQYVLWREEGEPPLPPAVN